MDDRTDCAVWISGDRRELLAMVDGEFTPMLIASEDERAVYGYLLDVDGWPLEPPQYGEVEKRWIAGRLRFVGRDGKFVGLILP